MACVLGCNTNYNGVVCITEAITVTGMEVKLENSQSDDDLVFTATSITDDYLPSRLFESFCKQSLSKPLLYRHRDPSKEAFEDEDFRVLQIPASEFYLDPWQPLPISLGNAQAVLDRLV